jgi:hypothetical protein
MSIGDGEGGGVAAVVSEGMGYGFSADRFGSIAEVPEVG